MNQPADNLESIINDWTKWPRLVAVMDITDTADDPSSYTMTSDVLLPQGFPGDAWVMFFDGIHPVSAIGPIDTIYAMAAMGGVDTLHLLGVVDDVGTFHGSEPTEESV